MDQFLIWIEQTRFSLWVREDPSLWAFPAILIYHAVGMGMLVGPNIMINLRLLGFAPGVPLAPMEKFYRVMWIGLVVNILSGLALFWAYPTKAVTKPLFYVKLLLIALAVSLLPRIRSALLSGVVGADIRRWAMVSLGLWISAITAGRLLAYTYKKLMTGD